MGCTLIRCRQGSLTLRKRLIGSQGFRADFREFRYRHDVSARSHLSQRCGNRFCDLLYLFQILLNSRLKLDVLRRSPHLEAFLEKGIEVLFLTDPVDEVWVSQGPISYDDKPFKSIGHGEVELGSDEDKEKAKEALEKDEESLGDLLKAMNSAIQDDVKEVRLSSRLKNSASCLVLEEGDLSPQLEAMLRQAGQEIPERKPILELNPEHQVLIQLGKRFEENPTDPKIADSTRLLLGQAVLAEGGQLEDPSEFAELVNKLMTETL